jgi:hypothetical protein
MPVAEPVFITAGVVLGVLFLWAVGVNVRPGPRWDVSKAPHDESDQPSRS